MASPTRSEARRRGPAESEGAPDGAVAPAGRRPARPLRPPRGSPSTTRTTVSGLASAGQPCWTTFTCVRRSCTSTTSGSLSGSSMPEARPRMDHSVSKSIEDLTSAPVLCDASVETPVFVRFSTVAGSRGSADTARDVRGFAVRFYTVEGNWDLVGNNIPVFFIQDGIKFPDLIHAVKPEPDREIPQAQTAHDTFWDFVSLVPESTHMLMWIMSDRAIPRSFRTMEGFGVHTFRLVNAEGRATLVKFHWKPVAGMASLVWEEAQKLGGIDPTSTVGTCGKPSRRDRSPSGTWVSRYSPTTTSRPSRASTCWTRPSSSPRSSLLCRSSAG